MDHKIEKRDGERGGAAVKFVAIFAVILLLAHAGWNYIPVAYEAETLRSEMQTAVVQGLALPGKVNPVDNVKTRIQQAAQRNNIPADVVIDVKQAGNSMSAHVAYQKNVNILPFGLYKYNFQFDHTATPTGFLMKDQN